MSGLRKFNQGTHSNNSGGPFADEGAKKAVMDFISAAEPRSMSFSHISGDPPKQRLPTTPTATLLGGSSSSHAAWDER